MDYGEDIFGTLKMSGIVKSKILDNKYFRLVFRIFCFFDRNRDEIKTTFVHQEPFTATFNTCYCTTQYIHLNSLPGHTSSYGYCVPKNRFQVQRRFSRLLMYNYKYFIYIEKGIKCEIKGHKLPLPNTNFYP